MCPGCGPLWTIVHVLCSIVYVACGATQLVAGIFLFITVPELHLTCNICAGAWNVVLGIAVGMIACFAQLSSRRQESLLYLAVSIIIVNAVDAVLTEWCLYIVDLSSVIADRPYQALINYACLATRIAIGVVILTSFVDSQLAFCSLQITKKLTTKTGRSHEQVSDIEYIIPRPKSSKPSSIYNAYTQSWVFEADNSTNSPYFKLTQNGNAISPAKSTPEQTTTENPIVHVQEASDDSGSDQKTNCLRSFTPSASPIILSASSSQLSLVQNPPIYEHLERLTEPSVYRSRLSSALSNKDEEEPGYQPPQSRRVEAITPQSEKVQYASLMKELQKAIGNKKESPQISKSSSTKSSDAEFSKELEAALQLIHDLESPNTIETPSEPKAQYNNGESNCDSDKTLSAVGSLGELASPLAECQSELTTFKPPTQGKDTRTVVHCDSQSTSGYSSPTLKSNTHTPINWSTASSVNSSHNDLGKTLSYTIHNTKSNAIISLYSQDSLRSKGKSITLVNITNDDLENHNYKKIVRRSSSGTGSLWNMRSLLRMKKQELPKLCPELEGAIIKSESLAYLSELELLARHQRNKNLERQIEQRVLQQMGSLKTESDS